jgi:hypothetical protein
MRDGSFIIPYHGGIGWGQEDLYLSNIIKKTMARQLKRFDWPNISATTIRQCCIAAQDARVGEHGVRI